MEEIREVITKGNEPMIFMRLADLTGTIETVGILRASRNIKKY